MDRNGGPARFTRRWTSRLPRGGRGSQQAARADVVGPDGRLPRGGRGSQLTTRSSFTVPSGSPPARGAWIATLHPHEEKRGPAVASREGGVDRNTTSAASCGLPTSRLPRGGRGSQRVRVIGSEAMGLSPPARGAWIATTCLPSFLSCVWSPPARGAWIATVDQVRASRHSCVASREGGVDRNVLCGGGGWLSPARRLPRGGRGSQHYDGG